MKNFWSKIIAGFATLAAVLTLSANVQAAELGGKPSVNLSENRAGLASTHTVNFQTSPTGAIPASGRIDVVYPAGFDLTSATLGSYSANLGTNPTLIIAGQTVRITLDTDGSVGLSASANFQLDGIVNNSTSGNYFVNVQTYDAVGVLIDGPTNSFDFSIQPRGPNQANSTIATNPVATTTMVVGTSIQIDFTARDDFNNTLANQSVEWTVSDSSFGLSKTSGLTNANGLDSVTLTAPTTAGLSTTVTARSGDFSYNITLTTASIVTTHDVLHHWDISCIASQTAGNEFTFTVTPLDQYNNVLTDYDWTNLTNRPTFTGLNSMPGYPVVYTFDSASNGVATYRVTPYAEQSNADITATLATITGVSNNFDVDHNIAVSITVAPNSSTILAGNTQTYTVTAIDTYGNTWDVTADSTFTIVEAGHNGSWNNNVYTSHTAGAWTVRATYNALTDDAVLNVIHNTLDHIDVDPDSTQTITAGDTIQFVAQGYDAYDNLIGGLTFEWNNADSTGLFDETTSGTYDVYAYIDNIESNHVDVIVNPGLASNITIQPSTNTDVSADTHQVTITATVRDQYGNLVADGTQINWTSTNFTLGLVSSTTVNGVATVVLTTTTHAGDTGTVTGTVNGHSATTGTITVVHGALDHISISPSSSDIDQSGHTQSYTANAYDQYGNSWNVTSYTSFSIDSDDAFGRLSDNTYTAGQIGTHHVYANYSGKTATATVNVLSHASVSSILITNKITNLYVGLTHNMQVRFRDAYGNSWDGTTLVTWTISPEGYATIDANGVITGILPGTFTVTATYGSHHDDDSIVVLAVAGVTQQTSGSNNAGADDNGQIKGTEITTLGEDNTTEEEPVSNRNWIIFLVGLGAVILAGTYMIFTYFMQDSNGQNGDNSEKTEEKEEKKPKVANNTKTSEQTRW